MREKDAQFQNDNMHTGIDIERKTKKILLTFVKCCISFLRIGYIEKEIHILNQTARRC